MSELTKNVKITEEAHNRLREAAEARYGTTSIRWSDVVETLCNEEISRQDGDDE